MRYELLAGCHVDATGCRYVKTPGSDEPVLVDSDEDLLKLFPGQFRHVGHSPVAPHQQVTTTIVPTQEQKPQSIPLGEDVSDQFPKAAKADLKVFKSETGYRVADADEPGTALDDGSLTSKTKTQKFIDDFKG